MDIDTEHGMAQRGEAVAWIHAASGEVLTHHPQEYGRAHEEWVPLYTAPPSAPVRVNDVLLRVSDEDLRWCKEIVGALQEAGGPTNNMRAVGLSRLIAALEAALGQGKA